MTTTKIGDLSASLYSGTLWCSTCQTGAARYQKGYPSHCLRCGRRVATDRADVAACANVVHAYGNPGVCSLWRTGGNNVAAGIPLDDGNTVTAFHDAETDQLGTLYADAEGAEIASAEGLSVDQAVQWMRERYNAARVAHVSDETATGYTPGPWEVQDGDGDGWFIGAPGADAGHHLAKSYRADVARPLPEDAANAGLISSAPDLYEALKELMGAMGGEPGDDANAIAAWRKAQTAIAKVDAVRDSLTEDESEVQS